MSGIYLHIPFCKQACHYCDFHFSTSLKKKDAVITALVKELELRNKELITPVETIYFGGGTPSLLSVQEINLLLTTITDNYSVIANPEITLEANPDDLSSAKIQELADSKINRLSIGIQSFYEDDLQLMNRAHNAGEAEQCLVEVTQHFDNVTIDLIYGIPDMDNQKWLSNIEKALSYGINHISSYALTVEPKTALEKFIATGKIPAPDDEVANDHFQLLVKTLTDNDFVHYELSNFGKQSYFSRHNTSYWQGKHYLGIGPSAHSFNGVERSWNIANNSKYIKGIEDNILPIERETLSINDRFNEYIMTGLRTIFGVSLSWVKQNYGEIYHSYLIENVQKFIQEELLEIKLNPEDKNEYLYTTQKGKFLCDGIASELFYIMEQ